MKLIYVASPFRGEEEKNIKYARKCSRYVVDEGHCPLTPHLFFPQFISEEKERDLAIALNTELLLKCDELWVFGEHISPGMAAEIELAKSAGIKVREVNLERD